MRQVPLERDINIAVNGPLWVEDAKPEHTFTAMLISRSRGTCLIVQSQLLNYATKSLFLHHRTGIIMSYLEDAVVEGGREEEILVAVVVPPVLPVVAAAAPSDAPEVGAAHEAADVEDDDALQRRQRDRLPVALQDHPLLQVLVRPAIVMGGGDRGTITKMNQIRGHPYSTYAPRGRVGGLKSRGKYA